MSKVAAKPVATVEEVKKEEEPTPIRGNGTFAFPDGSIYVGDYLENLSVRTRDGEGTFTFGPESYVGSWLNDVYHGKGKYKFASGSVYEGSFVNGLFDGEGTYTFPDGAVYKGWWKQNNMHGKGEYTDSRGVKWGGNFFNGMFDTGKSYISLRPIVPL